MTGSTITWANVGPILAGGYTNISLTALANGSAVGTVVNNVVATGKPAVGCNITASASESVLIFKPSITITKTSDVSVGAPSTNVNFTLTVKNTGLVPLNPVKVVDTLPTGLNYVNSGNGSAAGNIVTWTNIGPMAPGQTKQIWMVAHINGAVYGALNNTVDVTGTPPAGANVTNQSYKIVTAQQASITIAKSANLSVGAPSTNVNFTLVVKNTGQVALNPVKVVDSLPTGLNYVSSGNGSAAGNIVTWTNIGP